MKEFQALDVGHEGHNRCHGGRVVKVTTGGDIRQQEVVAHQQFESAHVAGVKAHALGDVSCHVGADDAVITRVALADVMQEGPHEKQVRSGDVSCSLSGVDSRLHQVAIHRELVHGVALWERSDRLPFRNEAGNNARVIQRLQHRYGRPTCTQERHPRLADVVVPWYWDRKGLRDTLHRRRREHDGCLGRSGGGPQQQTAIVLR